MTSCGCCTLFSGLASHYRLGEIGHSKDLFRIRPAQAPDRMVPSAKKE